MAEKILSAIIIEEASGLTLQEFCHTVQVADEVIIEMVDHQVLQPHGTSQQDWRFDSNCLRRAKKAISFKHDLEVNDAGIALVLDLLDQINELEQQLNALKKIAE